MTETLVDETTRLRAEAEAQKAHLPQYAGHFDTYVAVRALRDVKMHGVVVANAGEFVLMDPASIETIAADDETSLRSARGRTFATFYFARNIGGCDTSCRADYFDTRI